MLERDSESVGGRAGESGRRDELSEGAWRPAHGRKYGHRLVDDSDAARLVHVLILLSHDVRRNFSLKYGFIDVNTKRKVLRGCCSSGHELRSEHGPDAG